MTIILVVDDEPDLEALILQKFRHQIRNGAISFLFARDGVEALAALKANGGIDLVVTDINMPRMDGLSLLQKLQEYEEKVSVRAPVFAADTMVDEKETARVVATLDFQEPRVIRAPEGLLPVRLEVIALVDVGAGIRSCGTQRRHGSLHAGAVGVSSSKAGRRETFEHRRAFGEDQC
jgi:CheY-like chemotaxis protein